MNKKLLFSLVALVAVLALVGVVALVVMLNSGTKCASTISDESVEGGIVVPSNAECVLEGVNVIGDIKVEKGGLVNINAESVVKGSVRGEGQRHLMIQGGSVIDGDVSAVEGSSAYIGGAEINGALTITENSGRVAVVSSTIGGDVRVDRNSFDAEPLKFNGNTIGGQLLCEGNANGPAGSENAVDGEKSGQCTDL